MRVTFVRRFAFAIYLLISSATTSFAVGPNTQTISPTYDSVVRVLKDAGLPNGQGFMEGTGSVVANQNVNGNGYLWVLTADHVVSSTGTRAGATVSGLGIAFGNSPTGSGNSTYFASAIADASHTYRGSSTGLKDMALFGVNYGAYDPAKDALAVDLLTVDSAITFTDIGFGNQGDLVANGYQAQGSYGTQRYYNQRVLGYSTFNATEGYIYDAAQFTIRAPTFPNMPAGSGAALDGDSGSPWFSTASNGTYFTDGQFGLLTSVSPAPTNGLFAFGAIERGVAFTQDDLNWVSSIVPEPGSIAVFILTGIAAVRRPRLHA